MIRWFRSRRPAALALLFLGGCGVAYASVATFLAEVQYGTRYAQRSARPDNCTAANKGCAWGDNASTPNERWWDGTNDNYVAAIPATTKGDVPVWNGANWAKLSSGTNGQCLTSQSSSLSGLQWAACGGGGGGAILGVNVLDYSGSDLSAQINAADSALGSNPGVLIVPPGNYIITGAATIGAGHTLWLGTGTYDTSGVTGIGIFKLNDYAALVGDGWGTKIQQPSTLVVAGAAAGNSGNTGWKVQNLQIYASPTATSALDPTVYQTIGGTNSTDVEISGVLFYQTLPIAFQAGADSLSGGHNGQTLFVNNMLDGVRSINLSSVNAHNLQISGNIFVHPGGTGAGQHGGGTCIDLEPNAQTDDERNITISNNTFDLRGAQTWQGVTVQGGSSGGDTNSGPIIVANNNFIGEDIYGGVFTGTVAIIAIGVYSAHDVLVTGNDIQGSFGQNDVVIQSTTRAALTNNRIQDVGVSSPMVAILGTALYTTVTGNAFYGYVPDRAIVGEAATSDYTYIANNTAAYPAGAFGGTAVANWNIQSTAGHSRAINNIVNGRLTTDFGGPSFPIATKTSAYTLTENDYTILADATSAAFSVTLPTAIGIKGREYKVKRLNSGSNAVTLATTSSQTIDGSTTHALTNQYDELTVVSDGANWQVSAPNVGAVQNGLLSSYQSAASTSQNVIGLTSAAGPVLIRNNATPLTGSLFAVQSVTGSVDYLDITYNGSQIFTSNADMTVLTGIAFDFKTTSSAATLATLMKWEDNGSLAMSLVKNGVGGYTFLGGTASQNFVNSTGDGFITSSGLASAEVGNTTVWDTSSTALYPDTDNAIKSGKSTNRWQEVWSYQYSGRVQSVSATGAVTVDPTLGETAVLTATGNVTGITINAGHNSQQLTLVMIEDAGGADTWPSTITGATLSQGSFTKTTTASAVDTLTFRYDGTSWREIGRSVADTAVRGSEFIASATIGLDAASAVPLLVGSTASLVGLKANGVNQLTASNGVVKSGNADGYASLGEAATRWNGVWSYYYAGIEQNITFSATPGFNPANGETIYFLMTGNVTSWTLSAGQPDEKIVIYFVQDATGSRTLSGTPANVRLSGGALTLTTTANKVDALTLRYSTNLSAWVEVSRSLNE